MSLERQIESLLSDAYRRVWIQRSKYSLCVTLFPISGDYRILTARDIFHGFGQETTVNDVLSLLKEKSIL